MNMSRRGLGTFTATLSAAFCGINVHFHNYGVATFIALAVIIICSNKR